MAAKWVVSALQMASGADQEHNLRRAAKLAEKAVQGGAQLLLLPENFAFSGPASLLPKHSEQAGDGPVQNFLASTAKRLQIYLAATVPLRCKNPSKVRQAALLYAPDGRCLARYDKIHLFDVTLAQEREQYCESDSYEAGDSPCVVDTEIGRIGIAICYDLRFPELFRRLLEQGAELLLLPSAFTYRTGLAHWELLVRTRAIENLCFLIAANQDGPMADGKQRYGHSMIVDCWGQVMAAEEHGEGVIHAVFDSAYQQRLRIDFPALQHRRLEYDKNV